MTLTKHFQKAAFHKSSFGSFPCPHCDDGAVKLDQSSLKIEETGYSKSLKGDDEWQPHWVTKRFIGLLRCDNAYCKEIVSVCGETDLVS